MKGLHFTTLVLIFLQGIEVAISFETNMWATRYSRSFVGKMLLEQLQEQESETSDLGQWYTCDFSKFGEEIRSKFIQFDLDEESEGFLTNCHEKGDHVFTQMAHVLLKGVLSFLMSLTTVNGILGRGSMFVFSKSQFRQLLHVDETWKTDTLLDLGSGDGRVTAVMGNYFNQVFTTEQSPSMRWRLRQQNYHVLEIDEWATRTYNVISCLNLLDRCDKSWTLLSDIRKALNPNQGRLVVAVVLPFNHCVESGSKIVKPTEKIPISGKTWEEQATSLINDVFTPAGFILESFTRLPYLCEGDMYRDFYVLSDAVFVLRRT